MTVQAAAQGGSNGVNDNPLLCVCRVSWYLKHSMTNLERSGDCKREVKASLLDAVQD